MPETLLLSQGAGQFGPTRALRGHTANLVPVAPVPAWLASARKAQEQTMLKGTCFVISLKTVSDGEGGNVIQERITGRYRCRLVDDTGSADTQAGAGIQSSGRYSLRLPFRAKLAAKQTLRVVQDGHTTNLSVLGTPQKTTNALLLVVDCVDTSGKVD